MTTVLRNARVLPELTPDAKDMYVDIVVDAGKIAEILPAKTAKGDDVLDMTGNTVLPGLIEAHLHLDLTGNDVFAENVQPDPYRTMSALKLAQDNLRRGYTTVRDLGDRNNIVLHMAKAVNEGLMLGPDILASGKIITPTESGNEYFGDMYLEADSPMEFRKAVRTQYQLGADWIKVMATGAIMNPGGTPGRPIIMEDELQAVCDTADYVGKPVSIHCHGAEGTKMAIRCGVRTVEHSSIMDDECIRMYLQTDRTFPIPTISPPMIFVEQAEGMPEHYVKKARYIKNELIESMRAAYKAGVKMGWGTDAGVYVGSHGNGIYEFRCRVNMLEFAPKDCLIQATKNNAEILMIDDQVGTLEAGKKANIVAFKGNPDEDINMLENIQMVMKAGMVI